MICPQPQCKAWTRVLETRHKYDNEVYRRYECSNGHRFSTMERIKEKKDTNRLVSDQCPGSENEV